MASILAGRLSPRRHCRAAEMRESATPRHYLHKSKPCLNDSAALVASQRANGRPAVKFEGYLALKAAYSVTYTID